MKQALREVTKKQDGHDRLRRQDKREKNCPLQLMATMADSQDSS